MSAADQQATDIVLSRTSVDGDNETNSSIDGTNDLMSDNEYNGDDDHLPQQKQETLHQTFDDEQIQGCSDATKVKIESINQNASPWTSSQTIADNEFNEDPAPHGNDKNITEAISDIVENETDNIDDDEMLPVKPEPNSSLSWTLPPDKLTCTLEEIRRGQVINKTAANECPVLGCGKKINENRIEPSPGTISAGLRTHVLFVHYANRKTVKKRKLGWTTKRRSQASPRKQFMMHQAAMSTSPPMVDIDADFDGPENYTSNTASVTTGLNLTHKVDVGTNQNRPSAISAPGSLLSKKVKQLAANKSTIQPSSLQSLMQATGGMLGGNSKFVSPTRQKTQDTSLSQKNFNHTTSSLFSILAGLTQQQNQNQAPQNHRPQQNVNQHSSMSRKSSTGANTINLTPCSKHIPINNNNIINNNPPINSSLLTLLNEKISGNVATSLQSQLRKSLDANQLKVPTSSTQTSRQNNSPQTNLSYYQTTTCNSDANNFNNTSSILGSLCASNNDSRLLCDNSLTLNSFIELIAIKTGSNIGSVGIAEVKKVIEKFTTSLMCSSQTIADHYLAPFPGDMPQQKPEISPSDVTLAYKMMHKSHTQPQW